MSTFDIFKLLILKHLHKTKLNDNFDGDKTSA